MSASEARNKHTPRVSSCWKLLHELVTGVGGQWPASMCTYTYTVGEFITVQSDFELFLFDTKPGSQVSDPDIVIQEAAGAPLAVERRGSQLLLTVPPSLPTTKTSSAEPVAFTKALLTAIDQALGQQNATLVFGGALQTPDGVGIGLFGDTGCGKSTTAFRLAQQQGYQLLADDLLICRDGSVHPFPRYLNLRRDVPAVEAWVRSSDAPSDRIRRWNDQLDVPRALVSKTIPDSIELEYACLLDTTAVRTAPEIAAVTRSRAADHVTAWNRMHLDGWTADATFRDLQRAPPTDRRGAIREVLATADCYRLAAPKGQLPRVVTTLVDA